MRRNTWWAAAVVCAMAVGSVAALGVRATTSFDAIEAELTARQDALGESPDPAMKKTAKLYARSLEKLAKDSDSLASEIKLGAKVLGKLAKLDDPDVTVLIDDALVSLADEVLGGCGRRRADGNARRQCGTHARRCSVGDDV